MKTKAELQAEIHEINGMTWKWIIKNWGIETEGVSKEILQDEASKIRENILENIDAEAEKSGVDTLDWYDGILERIAREDAGH